jgi:hypothetical protein
MAGGVSQYFEGPLTAMAMAMAMATAMREADAKKAGESPRRPLLREQIAGR